MAVNIKKEFGGTRNRKLDLTTLIYGKVPPQAPDLEEAVIGACMLEKDTFAQVLEIIQSADCFYVDAHQKIYAAMRRLFDKGTPVDLLTITDELRATNELEIIGGAYYLTKLTMSVLTSAHVEAHSRIVMEKFIQRELIRISGSIISDAYEDSSDVFDLLDKAESGLYEITDKHLRKNFRSLKDVMVRTVGEIEESMKKTDDLTGVPSGFAALDRITGGWQRSDLIILAARPSVGKTALCLNIAMNAAMNAGKEFPVAVFSLEMGAGQIVKRMLSAVTEVSMESITRGKMNDSEFAQMTQRMERLSKAKIFIDDQAALNIFELRAKARRLKQKHGIELIVIDYLQLMQGSVEKSGNREQEISKISRDLKALAKELDIPIIALSQLNRAVETRKESKMPQLSDLRECLSLETSCIYTNKSFERNVDTDMDLLSLHEGKIVSTNSHNIEKTKNEVFRLKTQSGRFIDATAKHKILTSDGYKKLGDITMSDSIALALNWKNDKAQYTNTSEILANMLSGQEELTEDIQVPEWFMEMADEKSIIEFLTAVWESDENNKLAENGKPISHVTKSTVFANQLLYLMAKVGIVGVLDDSEKTTKGFTITIHGKPLSESVYYDKVQSIARIGTVAIFDRNVPVSSNFVVNGIVVHNSGALEQDADLVMFLYRPEYYGINNDAMGETVEGETHISIAKHRNGSTGVEKLRFIKEYQKFVDFEDDRFGGFRDDGFTGNAGRDPRAGGDATVGTFLTGGGRSNPYAGIRRDPSEFGGNKVFVPGGFQIRPSAANDVNWDDDNVPPVRKPPPDEDVPF